MNEQTVGPVPSPGRPPPSPGDRSAVPSPGASSPRRLRRLDHVWPDRDGNIAYLLTLCVEGRQRVLNNEIIFDRLVAFLLDSPTRYDWFAHRFVVMPDHLHLIARQGQNAVTLGRWIKALKAVVGGLEPSFRVVGPVPSPGDNSAVPGDRSATPSPGRRPPSRDLSVGRVPSRGAASRPRTTRIKRPWRWQAGFHDHKFRTPESESQKWEYICLNPVRAKLVERPEQWPYAGEIFYDEADGPKIARGTPPLLRTGTLIQQWEPPREGTRPTT